MLALIWAFSSKFTKWRGAWGFITVCESAVWGAHTHAYAAGEKQKTRPCLSKRGIKSAERQSCTEKVLGLHSPHPAQTCHWFFSKQGTPRSHRRTHFACMHTNVSWRWTLRRISFLFKTACPISVFSDLFLWYTEVQLLAFHLFQLLLLWQICEDSIFTVLTLLFQDFCNSPWRAGYQCLGQILTDGNPFLPNQCLELITISVLLFVHLLFEDWPQIFKGIEI